jgi:hypothetical protein
MLLCRRLGQGLGAFYRSVAIRPLLYATPFAVCMGMGRVLFASHIVQSVFICLAGAVILGGFYWTKVLPDRLKSAILAFRMKIIRYLVPRGEVN